MSYTPTIWANGKAPALNADNLNKIENELVKLDNDVSTIEGELSSLAEKTDITTTTSTTMPNSYSGRLKVDEIVGECQQESTAGNQLLPIGVSNDVWQLQTDGGYKMLKSGVSTLANISLKAGTYTLSVTTINNSGSVPVIIMRNASTNTNYVSNYSSKLNYCTYTFDTDVEVLVVLQTESSSGTSSVGCIAYLMLNEGTTALPYEPYTNGASPNPSYPQEIKSVKGYNLLKNVATTKTVNGVTFTMNSDGSVTLNGTATSNGDYYLTTGMWGNTDNILGATGRFILTGTGTKDLHVYAGYGSGTVCSLSGGNIEAPFDAPDGVSFVFLRIILGVTYSNFTYYPMIRKASIADSTYVPYGMWGVKVRGKNFLKNTHEKTTTTNGLTFITNDDGTITINGTATANAEYNLGGYENPRVSGLYQNLIQVSGTFSGEVRHMAFTKTWGDGGACLINTPKLLKENHIYMYFRMVVMAGTVCNNLVVGFVICEDLESSYTWQPYTESTIALSTELYGIGDVKDVIEGGKVKRKFAYQRVLGSNITDVKTSDGFAPYGNLINTNIVGKSKGICFSNRFIGISYDDRGNNADSFRCYLDVNTSVIFRVATSENSNFADLETVKKYFDENEVYAIYELAEEITEDLPLADQIALNSIKTYDGITYLEFDSEIEPTFKGEYGTSKVGGYTLEGMLASRNGELLAQSNANRITALEATVVNNI